MRIAVLGAGAMGTMFGGVLSRVIKDVWLVDLWKEHMETIRQKGLLMTKGPHREVVWPKATTDPKEVGLVDLIIVLVKGFDTERAIQNGVAMIDKKTYVMTLQNGIGNAEKIAKVVDEEKIIVGVTTIGSAIVGPGHIELTDAAFSGRGGTDFGSWKETGDKKAEEFCGVFTKAGILTRTTTDINYIIYNKLASAAGMAALTAISRLHINHVVEQDEGVELLGLVAAEVVSIANRKGVSLNYDEVMERSMKVYKDSTGHITSMLSDILGRRKTEVDSLNGAVVSEGKKLGVATPVNETLTKLMKLIEANKDHQILR